jgi:uncharacterized phosphosugar-binding protein
MTMTIDSAAFLDSALPLIDRLVTTQRVVIRAAARLVADCVGAGGVVQAFGTGHSQALAMEIAGRAGGLVPTNQLSLRDGVLYGGDDVTTLDPLAERDPLAGARVYALALLRPGDMFIIASNSGANGSVVEMASLAKRDGHPLVAFTSLAHSSAVPSRHPSGRKLSDLADVVIDNCAPEGDALLPLGPDGPAVCAISSITAAIAAQMLVADAMGMLLSAGHTPPVYASANVPGGDNHNQALEAQYAGHIRRGAA